MRRACKWIATGWVAVTLVAVTSVVGTSAATAWAAQEQQQAPAYTLAEYNAFQAAHNDQDPQNKITLLDGFIAGYPESALLPYVYRDYYLTYYAQKNYPKTIEYVDLLLSLGDKIDRGTRLESLVARSQAFFAGSDEEGLKTPEALAKTHDAASEGLKTLAQWQKPEQMTDDQYAAQKKSIGLLFNSVAGLSASQMRNYKAASASYRAALVLDPDDALTHYRLGVALLQDTPAMVNEGVWQLARSIAMKAPGEQQIRSYLRSQVLNYQQVGCERLVDEEINELLTLAESSGERPQSFELPNADDLQRAREDITNFLLWLQEGGDRGERMWLATCGLEYPDVPVRVLDALPADGDNITLKVYRPMASEPEAAAQEMQDATEPNMEVRVTGQAAATSLVKDDYIRFTGTLAEYQPIPFMLTWENAKVNSEDIPER